MGVREKIEERIRRKEQEIVEWTTRIAEARSYIQGLQEAVKLMPKEDNITSPPESVLRQGSAAFRAMQVLRDAATPLHISALLKAMGTQNTKQNRVLVGGTLSRYARLGQIFSRTGPNVFTLLNKTNEPEPPEGFGSEEPTSDEPEEEYQDEP